MRPVHLFVLTEDVILCTVSDSIKEQIDSEKNKSIHTILSRIVSTRLGRMHEGEYTHAGSDQKNTSILVPFVNFAIEHIAHYDNRKQFTTLG